MAVPARVGTTASEVGLRSCTPAGWTRLLVQLNALDQELAGHNATWTDEEKTSHALSLQVANAAFGQRGLGRSSRNNLDAIAAAFGAQLGLVDYEADPQAARKTINAWVSRQTAKRIPQLLAPTGCRLPDPPGPRQCHLPQGRLADTLLTWS